MFSPDDIKKVLGKDEKSQKKLQELLNILQKTKEQLGNQQADTGGSGSGGGGSGAGSTDDASEEAPSSLQQNPDLRRKMLQQKLYALKSKRMTNNAKTNMQEKIKKKILSSED